MTLKNSRSIFYLFTAMVITSVVIGSYSKIKFVLLSDAEATTTEPVSTKKNVKSVYAEVDVEMELIQVGEQSWYVQGKAGMATENAGFVSNAGVTISDAGVVIFDALGTPSLANKLLKKFVRKQISLS